jgi:hypothetical protein
MPYLTLLSQCLTPVIYAINTITRMGLDFRQDRQESALCNAGHTKARAKSAAAP